MPHLRPRHIVPALKKDGSWSPVVSVMGMRQVGKTTLLRHFGRTYVTLDDDAVLRKFDQGNWTILESGATPLVVDEAQKSPGLFDRVKLIVDRRKRPGQFYLTGSVRFLSRKQIRESLTGRTSLLELLPFTLSEAHARPLSTFVDDALDQNPEAFLEDIAERNHFTTKDVAAYLQLGGMPGICFKRDAEVRQRMRESHLEALLMRDLQLLVRTRIPFVKLRALLSLLAQHQGQPLSLAELGRQAQLSAPTVTHLLGAFEDLFIGRSHGGGWCLSDCGMAHFLGAGRSESALFHMERFVSQELYAQLTYGHRGRLTFAVHCTRGGVRVPFVIERENAPTLAITVDPSDGADEKSLKGLTWFAKKRRSRVVSVVLHQGDKAYRASTSALCIPYHWIA